MAESVKKGVIVEFDFAAMDGAGLLFGVTKRFLAALDKIPFDERVEAQYLAGGNYQGALAEYFAVVKTKKTAAKAAKDLAAAFETALNEAVPKAVTASFKNFVSALASKGVKVVIATRADVEKVRPAFEGLLGDDVVLYHETAATYGGVKWDEDGAWGVTPEFCDKDNKAVGGEDVLLMYNGRQSTSRYSRYTITDDNGLMTLYNEGAPCYLLGQWTIAANKKYTVNNDDGGDSGSFNRSFSSSFDTGDNSEKLYMPRFRRMTDSNVLPMVITHSLDFAVPSEIDQPAISCAADKAVYQRGWANYITDKMNVDTKVMTCKVDLRGLQVGQDLLRNFYYFEGCWWVLNQIKNYVVGGDDLTECEFIKVNDKTNYTNGQTY